MARLWSDGDMAALKAAVASGVLTVSYNGPPARTITYQSIDSMRHLLAEMNAESGNANGSRQAFRLASTNKGL